MSISSVSWPGHYGMWPYKPLLPSPVPSDAHTWKKAWQQYHTLSVNISDAKFIQTLKNLVYSFGSVLSQSAEQEVQFAFEIVGLSLAS